MKKIEILYKHAALFYGGNSEIVYAPLKVNHYLKTVELWFCVN